MDLPVAFYFEVVISRAQMAFKEVSGLSTELETETIAEGGVNDYTYNLPKQVKHGNLVLKRALRPTKYWDVNWIIEILENGSFKNMNTKNVMINLLNAQGEPLYTWTCLNAYPVKWDIDPLDSGKNEVLIESLELAYTKLVRKR